MSNTTIKPRLNFWQIWNMSFGFMGIQYGFGLQQANMSFIYRYLGADESSIPILWLAGPITGLLVQPIIGAMSDRTWNRLGRRRPYFLVGAILTSISLILMPNSSTLWMAAGLMWVLDASLNITMEPFRAFVADKLPEEQRTLGFAMQSFFVGLGQTLANLMPFMLPFLGFAIASTQCSAGMADETGSSSIPAYVRYIFYIGAAGVLVTVLWTMFTTNEYPPEDIEALKRANKNSKNIFASLGLTLKEIGVAFVQMPATMKQLWWVKFFTWFALPLMWQYLGLAIARHAFSAPDSSVQPGFCEGNKWGSLCFAAFNIACFGVSFFIPYVAKLIGRRATHAAFLVIGGAGFMAMMFSNDKYVFLGGMILVGLAWASILSMPYVMLSNSVPRERMGVYMGIFNMFIVIPQIVNMVTVPLIYKNLLGDDPRNALILAGICLFLAAGACLLIKEGSEGRDEPVTGVPH